MQKIKLMQLGKDKTMTFYIIMEDKTVTSISLLKLIQLGKDNDHP